jgi:Uncharacterized protein involved in methicillin resistance
MAKSAEVKQIALEDLALRSVFQSAFWAKVKSPAWHPFAFSFTIGDKSGRILVLRRTFLKVFSLGYVPFGPEENLSFDELASLSKAIKRSLGHSLFLIRYDLPFGHEAVISKPFLLCAESVQAERTVRIRLPEEFAPRERARRNIRKAEKCFTVRRAESEEDIEAWHRSYVETGRRDGFSTRSLSYVKKVMASGDDNVQPILYLAEMDGKNMGGILNLRSEGEEIYLFGATIKNEEKLSPGYLLQCHAISEAISAGVEWYDLFGIEGKDGRGAHLKSLTLFKTAFGGEVKERTASFDYPVKPVAARLYRTAERLRYRFYRR